MPGFYLRRAPGAPVAQGDIFSGVPIIGVNLSQLRRAVAEGEEFKLEAVEPDAVTADTVLVEEVSAITDAVVISQSCDAERVPNLMLAPLSPFGLDGKTAVTRWKKINHAATSLGEPKSLYLPGNPTLKMERRIADFGEAFTLPREYLQELAKRGRRVAGLGEHAIGYLQFRLAVLLTRLAQDDFAWPSADDLKIKIESLDEQIKEVEKKRAKKLGEIEKASGEERELLIAAVSELEADGAALKAAKQAAEGALPLADELAEATGCPV